MQLHPSNWRHPVPAERRHWPHPSRGGQDRCTSHRCSDACLLAMVERGRIKLPVYYIGPCALITHEVFHVRRPVRESFPIRDLKSIQIVPPEKQPNTAGVALFRILNIVLAMSAVV